MTVDLPLGDCLKVMAAMEPNSVDAIVTDPPYGLEFMGKEWDHGVPGIHFWTEAIRVAKPGAHLLAFGGTRRFHRLACAIEDAGWEIRDTIMWVYGSGFPKSHDVSKAIDKAAGAERDIVCQDRYAKNHPNPRGLVVGQNYGTDMNPARPITAPATDAAKQWDGWGTALKPAWEPIIVARKPLEGTIAQNVLKWGTGALNIDGCRPAYQGDYRSPARATGEVNSGGTFGMGIKLFDDSIAEAKGRWPANFALVHLPECEYLGEEDDTYQINDFEDGAKPWGDGAGHPYQGREVKGTRPVWRCAEGCPVAALDRQTGTLVSGRYPGHRNHPKFKNTYGSFAMRDEEPRDYGSGGGSRFFYQASLRLDQAEAVFYCGKVSPQERNAGLDAFPVTGRGAADGAHVDNSLKGPTNALRPDKATKSANNHPTLKPIDLNRWLAKLLLPPAEYAPRRILIPFAGAGSEMIGAMLAEWDEIIGIEMMAEYANIARARLAHWAGASQMELFNGTS